MSDRQGSQIWIPQTAGTVADLAAQTKRTTTSKDCPSAIDIQQNTPIYDGKILGNLNAQAKLDLMAEWARIFDTGPGIIVIKSAISDRQVMDRATKLFERIIEDERGTGGGDHFAKPGANDRVWNAAQKHCLADPEGFAEYFCCPAIEMASRAWLGDGYQLTAQVNRVNPGGAAQLAHRDYHLGFMPLERMAKFPGHVHKISPLLTLQGAVAHCDMPVESGPTLYLPYSQNFFEGYIAYTRPEFQDFFAEHHVQLPLECGDMVFFNPAVMHGSGNNVTKDIYRFANLLQVGSAFGRSIESVNRSAMVRALYPILRQDRWSDAERNAILSSSAEGYAFPTNLDLDPPVGSMNPESQFDIVHNALTNGLSQADFEKAMDEWDQRRRP